MDGLHPTQVLHELRIPFASSKPSATGTPPQHISGTAHNTAAVKLNSAVLVTNLSDFTCDALHTPEPKPAITGVAISPCSSMVAAYSTDCIYVAQLNGSGQLQKVGQLPGVKAVHWCPGRAVLAVFCQQVTSLHGTIPTHQHQPCAHTQTLNVSTRITMVFLDLFITSYQIGLQLKQQRPKLHMMLARVCCWTACQSTQALVLCLQTY